jgi:hypothetical protein
LLPLANTNGIAGGGVTVGVGIVGVMVRVGERVGVGDVVGDAVRVSVGLAV